MPLPTLQQLEPQSILGGEGAAVISTQQGRKPRFREGGILPKVTQLLSGEVKN